MGLGRYRNRLPLPERTASASEAVRLELIGTNAPAGETKLIARASLKRLPPVELTRLGNDRVLLGAIAERSGGLLAESPEDVASAVAEAARTASAGSARPLGGILAAAALVIFLLELAARALRPPRPGRQGR